MTNSNPALSKLIRENVKTNASDLATDMGYGNHASGYHLINGKRKIKPSQVSTLAKVLGVDSELIIQALTLDYENLLRNTLMMK